MKENISYIWIHVCKEVFKTLKKSFMKILCLIFFVLGKPVKIKTDISDKNIEVYLLQQSNDQI